MSVERVTSPFAFHVQDYPGTWLGGQVVEIDHEAHTLTPVPPDPQPQEKPPTSKKPPPSQEPVSAPDPEPAPEPADQSPVGVDDDSHL